MRKDRRVLFKEYVYGRISLSEDECLGRFAYINQPTEVLCRLCKKPVLEDDFAIYTTYRRSLYAVCHKGCHNELQSTEAYDCQKIDECCNDCAFFNRLQGKLGYCSKLNREVLAGQQISCSSDCKGEYFKHRKDV